MKTAETTPQLNKCYHCEEPTGNTTAISEKDTYWVQGTVLCNTCIDNYNLNGNKTGFCSLGCCISGECDESC